jgi:hypothetical protein
MPRLLLVLFVLALPGCGTAAAPRATPPPAPASDARPGSSRSAAAIDSIVGEVTARLALARARADSAAVAEGDTVLGGSRSAWRAWRDVRGVALVEETMVPATGGRSELEYVFDHGRLVAFRERGERVGLLPGRMNTIARVEVDVAWPAKGDPRIAHRIEGLPSLPDVTLAEQVSARAARLAAMADAARGAR